MEVLREAREVIRKKKREEYQEWMKERSSEDVDELPKDFGEPVRPEKEEKKPRNKSLLLDGILSEPETRMSPKEESGRKDAVRKNNPSGKSDTSRKKDAPRRSGESRKSEEPRRSETPRAENSSRKDDSGRKDRVPKAERNKKKKKGWIALLLGILLTILILGAIVFFTLWYAVGGFKTSALPASRETGLMSSPYVQNYLIIGSDKRENLDSARSDSMILLSLHKKTHKISMISLLRDLYLDIPGHGKHRLNAAYQYGGASLLIQTIEKNLRIPIHGYFLVGFDSVIHLIDAVGGISMEISEGEVREINRNMIEINMLEGKPQNSDFVSRSGKVLLDGHQALAYARIRKIGTDFGRTERQRKVAEVLLQKIKKHPLGTFRAVKSVFPEIETSLSRMDRALLALRIPFYLNKPAFRGFIPQKDAYRDIKVGGQEVLELNLQKTIEYLKRNLYES